MALQAKVPGDRDYRVCNPERDMVWALPRFVSAAIHDLGTELSREEYAEKLKAELAALGIAHPRFPGIALASDNALLDVFAEFVSKFGAVWHKLREDPEGEGISDLKEIFGDSRFSWCRLIISHNIMKRLMAEVSYWICQIEASSKDPPRPNIKQIEEATRAILDQLA